MRGKSRVRPPNEKASVIKRGKDMSDLERQQKEVNENYKAFKKQLPNLPSRHWGMHALMKNQKIVGFFDTDADAMRTGNLLYEDGYFSIQKVTNEIIDFGFQSRLM